MSKNLIMRYGLASVFLIWALGFIGFAFWLPQPAKSDVPEARTDAVVVPTGGAGRIARGLEVLQAGLAQKLLVSGVDPEVTASEFAEQFNVPAQQMACCITLGFEAFDTRSNASEIAQWIARNNIASLRLVTTDWHMARAAGELGNVLPKEVVVVRDAVPSSPSLPGLFLEYHKLIASRIAGLLNL